MRDKEIVYHAIRRYKSEGFDFADMKQEAFVALVKARAGWDPAKSSWAHYAVTCIWHRWGQRRCWFQPSVARIKCDQRPEYRRLLRLMRHNPGQSETWYRWRLRKGGFRVSRERFLEMRRASVLRVAESLRDSDVAVPEEDVEKREAIVAVKEAMKKLSERERTILTRRLDGTSTRDLGQELGISFQRVSQIEISALAKLRRLVSRFAPDPMSGDATEGEAVGRSLSGRLTGWTQCPPPASRRPRALVETL